MSELIGLAPLNPAPFMVAGKQRSPEWPAKRAEYLKVHGKCAACGATRNLNVHHKLPYHKHPELELDKNNFITLCETPTHNCHFIVGHLLDWAAYNPDVEKLAAFMLACMAKKAY